MRALPIICMHTQVLNKKDQTEVYEEFYFSKGRPSLKRWTARKLQPDDDDADVGTAASSGGGDSDAGGEGGGRCATSVLRHDS